MERPAGYPAAPAPRPDAGYPGQAPTHRPTGPGGPGGPGGPTDSLGVLGASGLPGSIDPRLRPHAGPPRGQSRSISSPPPPHRSIHPDSVDPATGRPLDPMARRPGAPALDDITPEWMTRRDPILDGIDVI
ncbi:hypothetical protein I6A84_17940 [Frankia sp. CNm7]|nr:hypothetical protein [Frankia nepalensis]